MSYCIYSDSIIFTEEVRSLKGQGVKQERCFWHYSLHEWMNWIEDLFQTTISVMSESFISISTLVSFVIKQKSMKFPIEKSIKNNDTAILFLLHHTVDKLDIQSSMRRHYTSSYFSPNGPLFFNIFSRLYILFSVTVPAGKHCSRGRVPFPSLSSTPSHSYTATVNTLHF